MINGVGKTDLGIMRSNNEDSFFVSNEPIGSFSSLFIVADGVGGSRAGEIASERAIHFFCAYLRTAEGKPLDVIMREAAKYANEQVCALAESVPEYRGMGTTLLAATVKDGELIYVHAGDSRMYYIAGGTIARVTSDHTYGNDMVRSGALTSEEAKKLVNGAAITRWIGSPAGVEPDIGKLRLSGDVMILMCSDGLSNMLSEQEMLFELSAGRDKEEQVANLIRRANANGGRDNITVILIG